MTRYTIQPTEITIKDTHRGLWYEDGVLAKVLEAGRHEYPKLNLLTPFRRLPRIEVTLVDIRERDMTIKGQEILTSDKVAIRVSIIVRFRVIDPVAAMHRVEDYEARIYSDVQLAARRSLASMSLEEILTNRNRLSDDILGEVKESAAGFGVEIGRADVKDLIFPGDVEQIMNRVLTSQRVAEAALIDARAKSEMELIRARTEADAQRLRAETQAQETRLQAEADAEAMRMRTQAEVTSLQDRAEAASLYGQHPALLRLEELDALRSMAQTSSTRLYMNMTDLVKLSDDEK